MFDHRQVVGDEEIGQAEVLLQFDEQVEDLGLDRDIERGNRFVADDEFRLEGERAGDADALALAAGKLERVAVRGGRRAGRPGLTTHRPTGCVRRGSRGDG